jgi:hypothetical protein
VLRTASPVFELKWDAEKGCSGFYDSIKPLLPDEIFIRH